MEEHKKLITLVVMEHEYGNLPGNATWSCFQMPMNSHPEIFRLMGHQVFELCESEAADLIKRMGESMQLQLELRALYHGADHIKQQA